MSKTGQVKGCLHNKGSFISQAGHEKCLKCGHILQRNVGDGE